jgi:hypothetical protein
MAILNNIDKKPVAPTVIRFLETRFRITGLVLEIDIARG